MIRRDTLFSLVVSGLILNLNLAPSLHAQTWTRTFALVTNWAAVASSADGSKIVAAVNGGLIYTSSDGGYIWSPTTAPATNWSSVACSADGMKLVAAIQARTFLPALYLSTNSGLTWSPTAPLPPLPVTNVACSADGRNHLCAQRPGHRPLPR